MKKCFIALALFCTATAYAQNNVGIGTASPHTSSLLDMSSTSKGILIPRMTTVQRTAIATPATGLMVYDLTTNSFWFYNGAAWTAVAGAGGLSFPYEQTVNTTVSGFRINNQGTGPALHGSSNNQLGIGINASVSGDFGWGVNAYSDKAGAVSMRSVADLGQAFYGENANAANNSTLMYLLNKGLGKTQHIQLANAASTAVNLYIAGNQLGKQVEIWQTNAANNQPAVTITNSGTGAALYGSSVNGNGILGVSGAGVAVRGDATSGTGVLGYSNTGTGLSAGTLSGTGIYTSSISGLALNVNGNLKIAGGTTSPGAGKVLTSDATGNATWQSINQPPPKVGFRVYGISNFETAGTPNNEMPYASWKKVEFQTESYDTHSAIIPTGSSTATSAKSKFTVPITGVYHFDLVVTPEENILISNIEHNLRLQLNRNGSVSGLAEVNTMPEGVGAEALHISIDLHLLADDEIWAEFYQISYASLTSIDLETSGMKAYFNGHLVFTQ
jgi:hypothetical protein